MFFQWYLFVLLVAVYMIATLLRQKHKVIAYGQSEVRYDWGPVLMITIPLIYLAATRASGIGDTGAYLSGFRNTPSTLAELPAALVAAEKDKGFTVFNVVVKSIIGNNSTVYFGVIAAICLLCVVSVYKKHSCNFIMSMFLFIASSDYVQWNYNGIRQFIAVAIIFAATDWLLEKKYIRYIALVLLASTLHGTALLMIPIMFIVQGRPWNRKTVLFLAAVFVAIMFAEEFTGLVTEFMENSQYAGEVDQFLDTEGTNILRVAVFSIPALLAWIFRKRIERANNPIINLSVGMSIASMGAYIVSAYTSGIFIGRIPIYFSLYNYILLPWIVESVFEKRTAKLIYITLIACYMVFYYYQMHVAWDFSMYM